MGLPVAVSVQVGVRRGGGGAFLLSRARQASSLAATRLSRSSAADFGRSGFTRSRR
jgi:hypothetical protein